MITQFSKKVRLIVLLAVLLGLFFVSSLYASRELSKHAEKMAAASHLVTLIKTAHTANRYFGNLKYWLSDLFASLLMRSEREAHAAQRALEKQLALLEPHQSKLVSAIRADIKGLVKYGFLAVDAHTNNERVLGNSLMAKAHNYIEKVDKHLGRLVDKAETESLSRAAEISRHAERTNKIITAIFIIRAVFWLGITIIILRSITRPLELLNTAVMSIAKGDLDAAVPAPGSDEIGKMSQTLEMFRLGLVEQDKLAKERALVEARLKESEARLRGAIDSLQEGFAYFDADDRLSIFNEVYRRMLFAIQEMVEPGVRYEDLLRASVARHMWVDENGREEEFVRLGLETHRNPAGPIIREASNGQWIIFVETWTLDEGTVITITDITELKKTETALREAKETAEKDSRTKSLFLANMSHELRTPLNSVIGFFDLMIKEILAPWEILNTRVALMISETPDRIFLK